MDVQKLVQADGVMLIALPFPETRPEIQICASVKDRRPRRRAEAFVSFSGIPQAKPIRLADLAAWRNCVTAIVTEAEKVKEAFNPTPKKPRPRK